MMYEEELKKLGLTGGESRIYLALLQIGESTVGPIVQKSGVAYSKVYEVLQRLLEKGFVSFNINGKIRYYRALEPSRLKEHIEKKRRELEESEEILKKIVPSLNFLSSGERTRGAEIFVGEKGIMTAYDLLLDKAKKNSTLRFFSVEDPKNEDKMYDFFYGRINYNNKVVAPTLKKKKMKWLGIASLSMKGKSEFGKPPRPIIQRYVSFPLAGNVDITDNAILITIWSDKPMAILVQSEEVAKNFREYFDSVWKIAKD